MRTILLILDSLGIGAAHDAAEYNDSGSDTLGHIIEHTISKNSPLHIPNLTNLGLLNAHKTSTSKTSFLPAPTYLIASHAVGQEISQGKDTPSGHWEIAGVPVPFDWHYFEKNETSFPQDLLNTIYQMGGLNGSLGNTHASGTQIIAELGQDHIETGLPIFYTSADSVFQIAAHEEHFGLTELYELCEVVSEITQPMNVGRVIARPFIGTNSTNFERTGNRHDYAIAPPAPTILNHMADHGALVIGIGKIADIYAHSGITQEIRAHGHPALWKETLTAIQKNPDNALIITNFVDFDALYGHRRDPQGYATALEEFDKMLPTLLEQLTENDLLILTADHGNDPTHPGTDHTRENIPILIYQKNKPPKNHGLRNTFADIAQTIATHQNLPPIPHGTSII